MNNKNHFVPKYLKLKEKRIIKGKFWEKKYSFHTYVYLFHLHHKKQRAAYAYKWTG